MFVDIAKATPIETEVARRGGLGLKRMGAELIGACPQCGGRDRFAVSIRKQILLCRGCGRSGDVIAFVQHVDQCDFKEAVRILAGDETRPVAPVAKQAQPSAKPTEAKEKESDQEKTERALRIWDDASEVNGTLAETYLRRRGLELPEDDEALRFFSPCPFGDTRYPALIALFRNIHTDEPKAILRTALTSGGFLIGKRMLGRVGGCAVKLDPDGNVGQGLVIGEGVETCLAARKLGFRPAWAVGSAGAIRSFPVLGGVECLSIVVDHDLPDKNGRQAGQAAALECSQRWTAAGREVRRIVPRRLGADMADLVVEVSGDG
jgi:CHC2-type zinc finger protein/Toprim domain-containing protein